MADINKSIQLVNYPTGMPVPENFKLVEAAIPELKDGEVLFKTKYFSLDPYMRGRMILTKSYIASFELNTPLQGGAICMVEQSKNPKFKVGDLVSTFTGWQTHAVCSKELADTFNVLPPIEKPSLFLGSLGMPGLTAYKGLLTIGQPKSGETVVVSAATGAVGSIVGQLAKSKGCRVVGVAGGPDKCKFAVDELGFDACVDHKKDTLNEDLAKACPNGIDVYFENVGGKVFWAVFPLLNEFARIPVCGVISWYNLIDTSDGQDHTPDLLISMVKKRLKFHGFIVGDFMGETKEFLDVMVPLVLSGKIKAKEDIVKGIENAPQAFIGLLQGKNFGKLIIEI